MGRYACRTICLTLFLSVGALRAQEQIIVNHKGVSVTSRFNNSDDSYVGSSASKGSLCCSIPFPTATNPQRLFVVFNSGQFAASDAAWTTFTNIATFGPAVDEALCQAAGLTTHVAVVGQTGGASTSSASYLDLVGTANFAILDRFVSSTTFSNWTSCAFASDGSTFYKYVVSDLRTAPDLSNITVVNVTGYTQTGGSSNPFDSNPAGNGPPYGMLPSDLDSTPSGVKWTATMALANRLQVRSWTSSSGVRYFVAAGDGYDCSTATGIQYDVAMYMWNASTNPPTQIAANYIGSVCGNTPFFRELKIFGDFAVVTERIPSSAGGQNSGSAIFIHLPTVVSTGSLTSTAARNVLSIDKGVDGIGTNLAQNKLFIGTDEQFSIVLSQPVNFSASSAASVLTASFASIKLATAQEIDLGTAPPRPGPFAFTSIDASGGDSFAPFGGGGSGKSISGPGCFGPVISSDRWTGDVAFLFGLLILVAAAVAVRVRRAAF